MPRGIYKRTKEHSKHLSENHWIRKPNANVILKSIIDARTGKPSGMFRKHHSERTKNKIRETIKRRTAAGEIVPGRRGKHCSAEQKLKLRLAILGKKYAKEDFSALTYRGKHLRIVSLYGKADHCENAKCLGKSKTFEWSSKNHKYESLKRKDWQQLCKSCHKTYDNKPNEVQCVN